MLERVIAQSEASQGYLMKGETRMFIQIKDYLVNKNEILYIKLIGEGARVVFKQGNSIAITSFNKNDIKEVDIVPDDEDKTEEEEENE